MPTISVTAAEAARNPNAFVEKMLAAQALASRERQEAATKKRKDKGRVSLGGSLAAPRYVDKEVRFTDGVVGVDLCTKVRTVSVDDTSEIPNLTLDQKADLKRMWDREEGAADEATLRQAERTAAERFAKEAELKGTYEHVRPDGSVKVERYADATPERLARQQGAGETGTTAGVRQFSDPFAVLRNKGLLDKEPSVNEALYQAGQDYRRRYEMADLGGVKAMNLMKDIVDGGSGEAGCPISDRAMDARRKLREGAAAVGPRLLPYLTGLLVEDRTVESMSGMVQDSKSDRLRYAIAMERVREALHRLCDAWGIRPNDKPLAIQSVKAGEVERSFERRVRGKA